MSSNIEIQRICHQCGSEFTARTTSTKMCSNKCRKASYKARERNEKIQRSNDETQRIKNQPIADIASKQFLSIAEMSKLTGVSRRTIYRMIERGELSTAKMGSRTILKRAEIDSLFALPEKPTEQTPIDYDSQERYSLAEVRKKYLVSDTALYNLIKRHKIPKTKEWRTIFVPKSIIDNLFK